MTPDNNQITKTSEDAETSMPQTAPKPAAVDSVSPSPVMGMQPAKHSKRKKLLLVVVIILVIAALGGGAYYLGTKNKKHPAVASTTKTIPPKVNVLVTPTASAFTVKKLANGDSQIDGRTWIKTPVEKPLTAYTVLSKDVLYSQTCSDNACTTTTPQAAYKYFQVGTTADGSDIVLLAGLFEDTSNGLFLSKDGKSSLLKYYSPDFFDKTTGKLYNNQTLDPNTAVDTTTSFPELNFPKTLTVNGKSFSFISDTSPGAADELLGDAVKKGQSDYAQTDYGQMLIDKKTGGSDYTPQRYLVYGFDSRPYYFQPTPNNNLEAAGQIVFNDGTTSAEDYDNGFHGCSLGASYFDVITDPVATFTVAAKAKDGTTLYDLNNAGSSDIEKSTLDNYNQPNFNNPDNKQVTMADFLSRHVILFFKNSLGQYAALYNTSYIAGGGCGKPVVYLYPTHTTKVSVKVDAKIVASNPNYGTGWDVTANPDGSLFTKDGSKYGSLYWEGYGQNYPEITNGFVVKQAEVAQTVSNNLVQLGLNKQEQSDFLAFWLPKLPKTPYVRLTWFGTNEVNKLAPLHISPAPDTLIRIFLDSEGLQQPIQLPQEHLSQIPRKGFTAVEWGGLLR